MLIGSAAAAARADAAADGQQRLRLRRIGGLQQPGDGLHDADLATVGFRTASRRRVELAAERPGEAQDLAIVADHRQRHLRRNADPIGAGNHLPGGKRSPRCLDDDEFAGEGGEAPHQQCGENRQQTARVHGHFPFIVIIVPASPAASRLACRPINGSSGHLTASAENTAAAAASPALSRA